MVSLALLASLSACETNERSLLDGLAVDQHLTLTGLDKDVHVVRTEGGVPHIYAASQHDAAYSLGFTAARDRWLSIDLARRLGSGRLAERYGEAGRGWDVQARITGISHLANRIDTELTPVLAARFQAYSEGVNAFAEAVRNGVLPAPSDLRALAELLGMSDPSDLLTPLSRRDVSALLALDLYQSSFSDDDVRRAAAAARIPTLFAGAPDEDLRRAGLLRDIWSPVTPLFLVASAPGIGVSQGGPLTVQSATRSIRSAPTSSALLARAAESLSRMQVGLHRDLSAGYGSNAWAVAGDATASGDAILAGDAHLPLTVPSVLYAYAIDVDGGGDHTSQLGFGVAGVPVMRFGTNGKVAFSQTQLGEDVTDWFAEQVQLDADGFPSATRFGTTWQPVTRSTETITIVAPPRLGGEARTETWSRYQTFDGRWLTDFEGRIAAPDEILSLGQVRVQGLSGSVVPSDLDGDGIIGALSFSYAGLDAVSTVAAQDAMSRATDVKSYADATRGLVGSSQASVVADSAGHIFYTGYQAMPCRADLARNPDGSFQAGADPSLLLDGTRHHGWHIATKGGVVDENAQTLDVSTCVVPFDKMPQSFTPSSKLALAANNDPAGLSFDGSLVDDELYLGGPWDLGFRADTIHRELVSAITAKRADVAAMATLQGNIKSRQGELMVPSLIGTLQRAASASTDRGDSDARLASLYASDAGAFDEIAARMMRWQQHGLRASSGVRTFYELPDDVQRDDAVSTMIFNAWISAFDTRVLGDERIEDILAALGPSARTRLLVALLAGRGDAGRSLASWSADREESVFFDDLRTAVVETADEEILLALSDALRELRAAPREPGVGGFGSNDMSTWLWGMRHQVRLQSNLLTYLPDPVFTVLTNAQRIDTRRLPLLPPGSRPEAGDPRSSLTWFPRGGDAYAVDAADPGNPRTGNYAYGSGPAMRMVLQISGRGVTGRIVVPGGVSSDPEDAHFADQARNWLADRAYPVRFSPREVVQGASRHDVLSPSAF